MTNVFLLRDTNKSRFSQLVLCGAVTGAAPCAPCPPFRCRWSSALAALPPGSFVPSAAPRYHCRAFSASWGTSGCFTPPQSSEAEEGKRWQGSEPLESSPWRCKAACAVPVQSLGRGMLQFHFPRSVLIDCIKVVAVAAPKHRAE